MRGSRPATRRRAPRSRRSSPARNSWSRSASSPRATKSMAAADSVTVRDSAGEIVITLDDLKKYHGRDFFNGLAMALKIMQVATATLGGGKPLDRRKLRLVLGLSPPGVLDGFEYITRAITGRRTIIDPEAGPGPESADGRYYFEVQY